MPHISERELQLPDAVIGKLLKIAAEDREIISLGPGEPDFITPKPILDYAKKIIGKATHYSAPNGKEELREVISKKLKKENKIYADAEDIIVTTGSQEGIFAALFTALDPTEQVIIQNPGYLGYIPIIDLIEAVPVGVRLREEHGFELEADAVKEAIDKKKTKVLLINTPANPTGNVLSKQTMEELADIAVEHDLLIFSDEAYEDLVYDKKHVSFGSLNGVQDRVVTFHTFSKSYAMAGFRLGYMHGPSDFIKAAAMPHHYMTLAPPHLSQWMALKALSLPKHYTNEMVLEYDRRRRYIAPRLNELGLKTHMPDGAFYTFSRISEVTKMNSYDFSKDLLNKAKVAVVPGSEFGKYGEGYIRCSYATKLPLIKEAMERIEKYLGR